ncbi:hypothetical protein [Flavobacterium sp.]|jgi:hypothetical protein|uniref:hypothetical protein n=1 Tax=Flavobacterium sp. TaxID=239 RepID=UPI0037BF80F9
MKLDYENARKAICVAICDKFFPKHVNYYVGFNPVDLSTVIGHFAVECELNTITSYPVCKVRKDITFLPERNQYLIRHLNCHRLRLGQMTETHTTIVSEDDVLKVVGESMITSLASLVRLYELK